MKILHASDLHGDYRRLFRYDDFDLYVDSGDFFPNLSRGKSIETAWQHDWFTRTAPALFGKYAPWLRKTYRYSYNPMGWYPTRSQQPDSTTSIADSLIAWLRGRPVLCVPGNHDWQSLCGLLRAQGYKNAFDLTQEPVDLEGYRFAGFREIPPVSGEWQGEVLEPQLKQIVRRVMAADPDIIVSHAPAGGILDFTDYGQHVGVSALTSALMYEPHKVKYVLHGHVHERGGRSTEVQGVCFMNSARVVQLIQL